MSLPEYVMTASTSGANERDGEVSVQVGVSLAVTRQRIRQIETRALQKLRGRWEAQRLRSLLGVS